MHMRLDLTTEIADKPFQEFPIPRICHHPDLEPSLYSSGFDFMELTPEDSRIKQKIMKTFGFRDNQPMR